MTHKICTLIKRGKFKGKLEQVKNASLHKSTIAYVTNALKYLSFTFCSLATSTIRHWKDSNVYPLIWDTFFILQNST